MCGVTHVTIQFSNGLKFVVLQEQQIAVGFHFVLLANSRVTGKASENVKSLCKSFLHNLLLQQQAQPAAGCELNENMAKPSRHLICNPSPDYNSQHRHTRKYGVLHGTALP